MINWIVEPSFMTDDELLAEYCASTAEPEDPRKSALAAEIEKRDLDR